MAEKYDRIHGYYNEDGSTLKPQRADGSGATAVDETLKEAWRTGNTDWDSFLEKNGTDADKAQVSQLNRRKAQIQSLFNEAVHGTTEAPVSAAPVAPYGGSLQPGAGQSVFTGQDGSLVYGASPQSSRHHLDMRATVSPSEIKSRNDTEQFFASRHGVVTENDTAWAQKFPNGATASRIATAGSMSFAAPGSTSFAAPTAPPLNPFSTTPGDANRIAQQYGGGSPAFTTFTPGRQSDPSYINGNTVYPPSPSRLGEINGSIAGTPFPALNVDTSIKVSDPRSNSIDWPELPSSRTASYR